jgi:hypothetical protein
VSLATTIDRDVELAAQDDEVFGDEHVGQRGFDRRQVAGHEHWTAALDAVDARARTASYRPYRRR